MEGELVNSRPSEKLTENAADEPFPMTAKFLECLPYYMAIGMPPESYWDCACDDVNIYRKAHEIKVEEQNQLPEIDLPHIPVPSFADGGFVDRGQLFLAREAGPELVGSIGSRTAVANNAQIIAGIREGVAQGMRDAGTSGGDTALLREAVALLRDILEKELVIAPSVSMGRMIEKSSRMYAQATDGRY